MLCKDASRSDLLKDLALHLETDASQDFFKKKLEKTRKPPKSITY
jgi:hypothetical protein